ncbi:MAG: UDP-N-acetylmuramoyl-L-alanine--D-glutamate ligase, partial [Burkholderiales bacterium]|nr:UDP-N-acetylmuramoyl-L-alanine--D-glutamate ligase [Burkholderiales bacterium]
IDDSKGTNVGATVAALNGLGAESHAKGKRIILIAGGEGKGQDFSPLTAPMTRYAKAIFLIGKAAAEMRQTFQECQIELRDFSTLEQAVWVAAEIAQEGDIVLLSPACASLDMFRNYAHRAQVFVDTVREVALARGEIA